MSDPEHERPEAALEVLLRAERERPPLDDAAVARIRRAANAKLGGPPDGPAGPASPGGGSGGAALGASGAISHAVALAVGLALGATAGWAAHDRSGARTESTSAAPRPEASAHASRELAVTTPASPPPPLRQRDPDDPPVDPTEAPPARPVASDSPDRLGAPVELDEPDPGALAAERRLIDSARAALAAGRPEPALQALETHARRHPGGALAEERDALRIEALIGAGRESEAAEAARQFASARPTSLYLGRVRAAQERLRLGGPAEAVSSEDQFTGSGPDPGP